MKLRSTLTGLLLLLLLFRSDMATAQVIPQPAEVQLSGGHLLLPTPLSLDHSGGLESELALFTGFLSAQGMASRESVGDVPGITLTLDSTLDASSYFLQATTQGVLLVGGDAAGVFYGLQTLRQLLEQSEPTVEGLLLPRQSIRDRPGFGYRGMHLDVSRHFFDIEFIKRYIDLIALHKMNVFHWHLTDDQGWRLESKAFPMLTQIGAWRTGTVEGHSHDAGASSDGITYGGSYSWEEVREIVAYAADRHITVIPEVDVPGHASAMIAAYPELGCSDEPVKVQSHFGVFPEILCPTEETFAFLETLLAEVAALFPGPYIHIGGDEVRKDRWNNCAFCRRLMQREKLEDHGELQAWFVNRTEAIVHKLGKRIIGWDEILDGEVRPSAVVMSWRGTEGGIRAAQEGHDVIMTPLQHVYFDFYQASSVDEPMAIHGLTRLQDVYAFQPVPDALDSKQRRKILGAQANLWTEYVPDAASAEYMVLPRMSALAEVLWTPSEQQDFDDFSRRLPALESLLIDLGYSPANSHYKPHIEAVSNDDGSFLVSLQSLSPDMRYSLDGAFDSANAEAYTGPFVVGGSAKVRAWTMLDGGDTLGDARLTLIDHLGRGAEISPVDESIDWAQGHAAVLVDGRLATDRIFRYPEWFAFGADGMDLILELESELKVSRVTLGVQAGFHRKLYAPTQVRIQVLSKNGSWLTMADLNGESLAIFDNQIDIRFTPVMTHRLRVTAQSDQQHWSEESSRNVPSTLRVDEIIVR
ncbi:MAG: family 20 glycosylhydrolase [Halioglobus sp.]